MERFAIRFTMRVSRALKICAKPSYFTVYEFFMQDARKEVEKGNYFTVKDNQVILDYRLSSSYHPSCSSHRMIPPTGGCSTSVMWSGQLP